MCLQANQCTHRQRIICPKGKIEQVGILLAGHNIDTYDEQDKQKQPRDI